LGGVYDATSFVLVAVWQFTLCNYLKQIIATLRGSIQIACQQLVKTLIGIKLIHLSMPIVAF
jgi:hypothetical protein